MIQGVRTPRGRSTGEPRRTVSGYIKICGAPSGEPRRIRLGDHTNNCVSFARCVCGSSIHFFLFPPFLCPFLHKVSCAVLSTFSCIARYCGMYPFKHLCHKIHFIGKGVIAWIAAPVFLFTPSLFCFVFRQNNWCFFSISLGV